MLGREGSTTWERKRWQELLGCLAESGAVGTEMRAQLMAVGERWEPEAILSFEAFVFPQEKWEAIQEPRGEVGGEVCREGGKPGAGDAERSGKCGRCQAAPRTQLTVEPMSETV